MYVKNPMKKTIIDSKEQVSKVHHSSLSSFSVTHCSLQLISCSSMIILPLLLFIIKFRYNARADWLKQRALSEYRCTEQRCHTISLFANFLDFSLGFIYFIIIIFFFRSRHLL